MFEAMRGQNHVVARLLDHAGGEQVFKRSVENAFEPFGRELAGWRKLNAVVGRERTAFAQRPREVAGRAADL